MSQSPNLIQGVDDAPDATHENPESADLVPFTAALLECATPAEVVSTVVEHGVALLGAVAGLVALVSGDGESLEIVRTAGYSDVTMQGWERFPLAAHLPLSDAVRENTILWFESGEDWRALYPDLLTTVKGGSFQASISLPLVARGSVFGGLHFSFPHERRFSSSQREFLSDLTRQCALALDRAFLLERVQCARDEAQESNRRLTFLSRASELLAESLDYQTRLEQLVHLCVPAIADWAGVDILDENGEVVRVAIAHHIPERESVMREIQERYSPEDVNQRRGTLSVIQSGERLFYADIPPELIDQGAVDAEHARLLKLMGVSAALSVPITALKNALGALSLGMSPEPEGSGRSFTPELIELVEEVARRAGVAIDNARLYGQARREIAERREAEKALQASEDRYRRLLDTALEGVLFVDSNKCITRVNDQFVRMMGYDSSDELVGHDMYVLLFPEDAKGANERWAARQAGVEGNYELRLRGKDDVARWFIAHVTVERDANGRTNGTFTLFTDITERRAAQQALQAKTDEVVLTLESMTDGFHAVDADWRITYINAEAQRIVNRTWDDVIGKVLWEAFPESEDSAFGHAYHKAVREGVPVSFEDYYPPLDVWLEVWAYPTNAGGLSVYFRDITERRQAEQERENEREAALLRQREFMRDIIWSLTEGRFKLCLSEDDLPVVLAPASDAVELTVPTMRVLRKQLNDVTTALRFSKARAMDIETSVGECAMNSATHGGGGEGWICVDYERGTVQVWIKDTGKGISEEALPKVLEKGVSTAGTLGHGFWLMLRTCDRIYLLTGPHGTTIVLEQGAIPARPAWLGEDA